MSKNQSDNSSLCGLRNYNQSVSGVVVLKALARMFHELPWRDREDGWATGQPQGVGSEAYLTGTSQGATSEDARKDAHIRGRSM
jgi:hypothetical protein